ncbi:MaoC family dehydratase N-terminal domain-containing protein [Sphingomonas sp. LR61]|uniref:FAS1-like dehydratase domain-containing protein n=1 Tax=Sphingomonas sp. LR61 TaxID=3050234 RepID=UPI002FE113F8
MSVNPELVGRTFPPAQPYLVGREKVREFSRAVFATNPVHHEPDAARAAGYADVVAPPTFAVVVQEATLAQLLAEPDAGIDFSRVVHGEQSFTYDRPIVAGDELTATLTVTSVKTLGGNAMVTAQSTMNDASGSTSSRRRPPSWSEETTHDRRTRHRDRGRHGGRRARGARHPRLARPLRRRLR